MARTSLRLLGIGLVLMMFLSGCAKRPHGDDTAVAPANACTPYEAPTLELGDPVVVRGANAFAYMIGLVCDHDGPTPQERARVPGTENHTEGKTYLMAALEGVGWTASAQTFTGSQYEAVMLRPENQGSSYKFYFTNCDASDRSRMRGLEFSNVVGQGGTSGGPIVLLMAHWDSKRSATQDEAQSNKSKPVLGANDGASGVGVLLELARVLATETHPFEIRILFTDGEDGFEDCHPLAGTTYYAENLPTAERTRVRAIVLLDMVGDTRARFYKGCGSDNALADRIWSIASRLDVTQFRAENACGGITDDHTPFEERGMRAVDVIDTEPGVNFTPYWHTTQDTPDKISADLLGNVARVLHTLIQELPPA